MIRLTPLDLGRDKVKTLLVLVGEKRPLAGDPLLRELSLRALAVDGFQGKQDEELVLFAPAGTAAGRVLFRGVGPPEKLAAESFREAAGKTVAQCIKSGFDRLWVAVPEPVAGVGAAELLRALMEGAFLANHLFDRYKQEKTRRPLRRIDFVLPREAARRFRALPARVAAVCGGTLLARDWVNLPSNDKPPERLARLMAAAARKAGLGVEILAEKELRRLKMGALLAVAAGSAHPPALLVLRHRPRDRRRPLLLVGKGVTFDSGGLNLKTGESLPHMKADMAGAAAVAATLTAAAAHGLPRPLVGVIPLVENLISGAATRPGDIVTAYSGKTVEIGNTDAEGRLILADAMAWAIGRFRPETLVDLATLTGACVVALGEKLAGVFSNDEALQAEIVAAGRRTHERCWPLPLVDDYRELLKSQHADINNASKTRWGGAISAALFLSEFVGKTRWAHIDIAGPAYFEKESATCGAGGTGFGVRLLLDWLDPGRP
jgi:leucyl aminopeptidase